MGYIEDSLTPAERVLYRAHMHWIIYNWALLLAAAAVLLALGGHAAGGNAATALYWFALIVLAVALAAFIIAWIEVHTTDLAVTNFRVLAKHGFFRREAIEQNLKTLDGVHVNQSVLGRILGYGSIETRGSGGGHTPIKNISKPLEFRKQVEMAANAFRSTTPF